jgi:hypothetical protein
LFFQGIRILWVVGWKSFLVVRKDNDKHESAAAFHLVLPTSFGRDDWVAIPYPPLRFDKEPQKSVSVMKLASEEESGLCDAEKLP